MLEAKEVLLVVSEDFLQGGKRDKSEQIKTAVAKARATIMPILCESRMKLVLSFKKEPYQM